MFIKKSIKIIIQVCIHEYQTKHLEDFRYNFLLLDIICYKKYISLTEYKLIYLVLFNFLPLLVVECNLNHNMTFPPCDETLLPGHR